MSIASLATDAQIADALYDATRDAWANYEKGHKTPDGHFHPGVRAIPGARISIRVNRRHRTEISISHPRGEALDPALLERASRQHARVQGSPLMTAYTQPRNALEVGAPLLWAVLHVNNDAGQPALGFEV